MTLKLTHDSEHTWYEDIDDASMYLDDDDDAPLAPSYRTIRPIYVGERPAIMSTGGGSTLVHLPVLESELDRVRQLRVKNGMPFVRVLRTTCPYTEAVPCVFGGLEDITELAELLGAPQPQPSDWGIEESESEADRVND